MSKAKKVDKSNSPQIVNRRAKFDYTLEDELTTGIVLTGKEVRAARNGRVHLKGAFVTIRNGELWLNNASFSVIHNEPGVSNQAVVDSSPKKLLASRKQIDNFASSKQQGYTIVPTKLLTNGKYIKLVIALGKGKKLYDKRETIKRRDSDRDAKRSLKRY